MARTTNRRSRTTRGRTTANRFAPSLNTSRGLYNLATKTGLQQQADNIIAKQQGETNQLFSGGLVSDFFDVLNAVDYGVVGMLKGQSFLEGMKNRESFADEDAIGKNLTGKILGTMLDIGVDPLTYIAPLTILKKVPGLTKLAKFAKTAVFGKKVKKVSEVTGKTFEKLEGGLDSAKFFAKKLTYMFGKDPVYRKAWEESEKGIATGQTVIKHMTKGMLNLDNKSSVKLLELGEDFRFDRVGIEKLKGQFSDKQIRNIDNFGKYIDELGRQQVDLGLLSKSKYEKNKGKYLKAFYEKHELSKPKGIFGFGKKKVVGNKARKNLTPEQIEELVRIENPAYIFSRTAMDMLKDIENTKFYNEISKKFASNVFEEGFEKLPISSKLFTTATGEKITMLSKIKNLNSDLKPVFKQLKQTFKADKNVLSQVGKLEKELGALKGLRTEEFNKFFQEGRTITKEVGERGVKTGIPVVEKLPKDLFDIAQDIKKGVKYDDIKLEKLFEEGVLERNGFKSIKDFVDYIKKPAEIIPAGTRIIEDRIFKLNELIDLAKTEKALQELQNKN